MYIEWICYSSLVCSLDFVAYHHTVFFPLTPLSLSLCGLVWMDLHFLFTFNYLVEYFNLFRKMNNWPGTQSFKNWPPKTNIFSKQRYMPRHLPKINPGIFPQTEVPKHIHPPTCCWLSSASFNVVLSFWSTDIVSWRSASFRFHPSTTLASICNQAPRYCNK